ncbi:MAG: choline BCCT transporter BetT [Escherichia coli]|nr:choline BCCT transporter BetT [Escherichia coli]
MVANPDEPRFCTFKDPVWGIRALAVTLITYHDKRRAKDGSSIDTIREVIERWAPPNENNTDAYINEVSKAVGVTADMIIDLHDYDILRPLVEAIIRHENGRGPLKTLNTWYAAEVIEEGLRRAGVVKPVKTVKAVPVTKETAGATVTAGIGLAQLADVMPQVSAAMDKAQGHISSGDTVRIIFGIATTLGIGVVQLNYGLSVLFDIPDSMAAKAALIALSVIIATISVTSGVDKGIRVLSELNVALALGLILFVLFMGDTSFLLNALVLNVGDYVNRFMGMTLNSFAFDRPVEWMNNWTLFFWAWWVAWSPFVGLFLARISRGRTIRQFVLGTLIIPFTFTLLWLSVFGNSALYEIIHGGAAFAEEAMVHPERGFYSLLAQYPAFTFSASVATITGLLFYVTSADSGALVLGNFTSQLKDINSDAPGWLRVFWSVAIGLLTLGMLMTNGISALQNTTVIMGLPFSFVIFFVMAGLYKSLKVEDYRRESANRDTAPRPLGLQDRLSWKKRLSRLMNYPGTRYTKQMMETVCYPAMEEVAQELRLRGAYVELKNQPPEEGQQLGHLDLLVHMGEEQNFVYQIWPQQYSVPGFTYRARSGKSTYYRLETFLLEGSQGNDLMDYSKEQVITDILDQYERHLNFIHLHREAPGHSVMFPDS